LSNAASIARNMCQKEDSALAHFCFSVAVTTSRAPTKLFERLHGMWLFVLFTGRFVG